MFEEELYIRKEDVPGVRRNARVVGSSFMCYAKVGGSMPIRAILFF